MKRLMLLALVASLLGGCAVKKDWACVGGSKADGTVKLAYDYGLFQQVELTPGQAERIAAQRCSAWGYSSSEAFGGAMQTCLSYDPSLGCTAWRVTADYQCTGGK